jgi:uncharacterized protein YneF (UPF0154 family)
MILTYILNLIGADVPASSDMGSYGSGVAILSIIALFSFLNIIGYFLSYILINKYDIKNISKLLFLIMEIILCIVCLLILIISGIYIMRK